MLAKLVILLIPFGCGLFNSVPVHGAFKFSRNGTIELMPNITKRNLSNTPAACHLKINPSTLKELLILTREQGKNAIELNVLMESVKNTLNKPQFLPEIIWANKIGRTIVSLIAQAENSPRMMLSSYTSTLTAGVDGVDVVISKAPKGCLLPGKNIADTVFYFLLHQLHAVDEDKKGFQLCSREWKNEVQYHNCCRIHGQPSGVICSESSSFLKAQLAIMLFSVASLLFLFILVPLVVTHLNDPHAESEYYKVSDSPMSLLSIIRIAFFLGHDPLIFFGRKLVITAVVLVTALPKWYFIDAGFSVEIYFWLACLSALIFLFFDIPTLNSDMMRRNVRSDISFIGHTLNANLIGIITFPFNLKFIWNAVNQSSFYQKHFKLSLNGTTDIKQSTPNTEITDFTTLLRLSECLRRRLEVLKYCLSIVLLVILYFCIAFPILLMHVILHAFIPRNPQPSNTRTKCECMVILVIVSPAAMLFIISIFKCLLFTFFFSTGLYLNGQFYRSSFFPLFIVLFYSWSNWRSSIEAKYVELITKIYEVCKESAQLQITENNTNDIPGTSTSALNERFKILLDDNGKPMIERQLYEIIREKFLPYDEALFWYFGRVFLITIFSVFLYLTMSTAETSGLSSVVLIMNTMATTSMPFILGVIWNTCSDEQKAANGIVLKSTLEKVLIVHGYNKATGEIIVEVREIQGEGENAGSESGGSESDARTEGENVRSEPVELESDARTQGGDCCCSCFDFSCWSHPNVNSSESISLYESASFEPGGWRSDTTTQVGGKSVRSEPGGSRNDTTTQECDSDDYPLVLVHHDSPSPGSRTNEEGLSDESGNEA